MAKKKAIGIVIIAAIIIACVLFYALNRGKTSEKTIKVSGNIETTEVRAAFRVAGKIEAMMTDEGEMVKKGQVLARLEKDELGKIRQQASANFEEAKYNYELTKKDNERAIILVAKGAITEQQRDTAEANFGATESKMNSAKENLGLAELRLGYAELMSPIDGFVLVKSAEAGEVVQIGTTVFTIADLNDIWLTAYINETDLGRVKLNQQADIKIDTHPEKTYKGRISFISEESEFTPKQIQTTQERVKLVYRIKIRIENPNLELKPGMPADGYISTAE